MNKLDIPELRVIRNDKTKILWFGNKYDGIPKNGLMLYNGEKCYYNQYAIDCTEIINSDEYYIKRRYTDEQIAELDEEDRRWYDEKYYYKVYKLSKKELFNIEYEHDMFRKKYGSHSDYYYSEDKESRDNNLDSLLDNIFIRMFKQIRFLLLRNKRITKSAKYIKEKNVVGYFRIDA